jgi:predicted ester cyclase
MDVQEKNKASFRRLIDEVINAGRLDLADRLLTADRPDYQELGLPAEATRGYDGFRTVIGMFRAAFPDLRFTSEFMIAENDMVLSYNKVQGTHRGVFMGIPPTGRTFVASAADVCRFDTDGKISAHWGVFDMFSLMVQLGSIAAPGQTAGAQA